MVYRTKRKVKSAAAALVAISIFAAVGSSFADDDFLPVDEAFKVQVDTDLLHRLHVHFEIHEDYSIYKDRITIQVPTPGVNLGRVSYPAAVTHTDEFFGPQQVYTHDMTIDVPLECNRGASESVKVSVAYQGCADAGLCYEMQHKDFTVELPDGSCTG